ncbi:MAG: hypothetical protein ACUVX8_12750 [Candidatus Zipacnadales bacterium]
MTNRRLTIGVIVMSLLFGFVSVAAARDWDRYYNQRSNYQGDFTNAQAWSATIVNLGPTWFGVMRYGERIRVDILEGNMRLYLGQRVRLVPFERDGRNEIAELRLPDQDFRPVGVVRYVEHHVPKNQPYQVSRYGYDSKIHRYNFGISNNPQPPKSYNPPARYRAPALYRQTHGSHWEF